MRRFLLTCALVVLTVLVNATTKGSTFIAFLDGANSWENSGSAYGFYRLTPGSNIYTKLYATPKIDMNGGGAIYDGKFHGTSWDQSYVGTYHEYNILDWTPTANDGKKIYNYNYWASSSAYDPVDGKVYLVGLDNDTFEYTLYQVDYSTFADGKKIKSLGDYGYAAMAFDKNGQLWAITAKGVLLKVNKSTGDETTVGNTGVKPGTNWESAAFDNKSGKLYWAAKEYTTGVSALYEVDTKTGKATVVSTYSDGEVFPFLYIEAAPDDAAPADISNLAATFDKANLTGTVTFTVPVKTYGGSDLTGNVDYTISIDGTVVKTGTAASGAKVSEEVTTTEGQHIISVSLKANGETGSDNKLQKWVGNDIPAVVSNPSLTINADGKATISWTAPTTGAHNGYIGNLTYTILDQDSNVVAKDLTATSYEVQLDKNSEYAAHYYNIVANNGDKTGEAVSTPYQCFGQPLTAPYISDFSTPQGAYTYEIVDNDNNGTTWGYDAGKKNVITDSFEAYTPWSISGVGDWTLVDRDKNYTYGFGNKFPNQGNPYAYIVFNPSAVGDTGNNLDPHTGSQYMAAFSSSTSANNDWLISPLLSGEAQTVSFWVKTVDDSYGSEAYEVLYSTTDTATTSFQVVNTKTTAPTNWTKITVALPAGSKYFAIHCVSNNCTMFAVDDVTYEAPAMIPTGYNIYKNGNKIASVDANTTTYTDASGETDDVYNVTAVYAEGESVFSNAASLNSTDGIETILTTDKGFKILYRVTDHVYIVKKDGKIYKTILKND